MNTPAAIVEFLEKAGKPKLAFEVAAEFNLDENDLKNKLDPLTLNEVIESGQKALLGTRYERFVDEMKDNEMFQKYIATVAQRGFFGGFGEESDEYKEKYIVAAVKFRNRVVKDDPEAADKEKVLGNNALKSGDMETAVRHYTNALKHSSKGVSSHIYHCNRAAAYSHLKKYNEAIADCEAAIDLDDSYSKAYSRLGFAHFHMGDFTQSVAAYEQCLKLDPANQATKAALAKAKDSLGSLTKEEEVEEEETDQPAGANPFAGMGGLGGLGDLLGGAGGAGGLDFGALLSNPAVQNMAQNLMSDPSMMQNMMNMMGGMGGMPGAGSAGENPAADEEEEDSDEYDEESDEEEEEEEGASSAPSAPFGMPGMGNLSNLQHLGEKLETDPRFASYREDPKMQEFFNTVRTSGPMSCIRFLSDPYVGPKLQEMLKVGLQ